MDYERNMELIMQSIYIAKQTGCVYRPANELEISGYSCDDHFFEQDLTDNCWECLALIIKFNKLIGNKNMIVEVGFPLQYNQNRYNVTAVILFDRILCLKSKENLAEEGVYNETRYFNANRWQSLENALNTKDHTADVNSGLSGNITFWLI
jgi:NAD+ synthase (glutamine-hydrolysing)